MWTLLKRAWRWVTGYEAPPKTEHERLMQKFSRSDPNNQGRSTFPVRGSSNPD